MSPNAIKDIAAFFDARYQDATGARYPFNNGKDAKILKDLRLLYTDDQIQVYMTAFFEVDDEFIRDSGFSLSVFRGCLPKVIAHLKKHAPKADNYGHLPPCRTHAECIERVVREGREARAAAAHPLLREPS